MSEITQPPDIRRASAALRFLLEIELAERLPGGVADDEAGVVRLVDRPGRRGAAVAGIPELADTITPIPAEHRARRARRGGTVLPTNGEGLGGAEALGRTFRQILI